MSLIFPFAISLYAQAAGVVLIVAWAGWRGDSVRFASWPRPEAIALGLWSVAAVFGALVGVLSGNPARTVLSQFLAMVLLPMAAMAFVRWSAGFDLERLIRGLAMGAAGVLLFAAVDALVGGTGLVEGRLRAAHNESLADAGLMLLVLGVAAWSARRVSVVPSLLGALLVAASQGRGQWFAAAAALAMLIVVGFWCRPLRRASNALCMLALTAVVVGGLLIKAPSPLIPLEAIDAPSPLVVDPAGVRKQTLVHRFSVTTRGLEIRARVDGNLGSRATLFVEARSGGRARLRQWAPVVGSGTEEVVRTVIMLPPLTDEMPALNIDIGLMAKRGPFALEGVEILGLESAWQVRRRSIGALPVSARIAGTEQSMNSLDRLLRRAGSALRSLRSPRADDTMRYRLAESAALLETWRQAGMFRRVVGHGLGAVIRFDNPSWAAGGERVVEDEANYLHNAYLFLLYKLGLVGVLAGLAWLVMVGIYLRRAVEGVRDWRSGAAGLAWAGYWIWAVTSPEIIDFRMAPLLGALTAAVVVPSQGSSASRVA